MKKHILKSGDVTLTVFTRMLEPGEDQFEVLDGYVVDTILYAKDHYMRAEELCLEDDDMEAVCEFLEREGYTPTRELEFILVDLMTYIKNHVPH